MANFGFTASVVGLGTKVLTSAPAAGQYVINGVISLPQISQGDALNSQVVVVVKKNATTIFTSDAGDSSFYIATTLAANDAISIILSSSLASDNQLNAVKTTVNIYEGQR